MRRSKWMNAPAGLAVRACDRLFALCFCHAWAPLVYLLLLPLAEAWFFHLRRRFVVQRRRQQHFTHQGHADAAEAIRHWESWVQRSPEEVGGMLRGYMIGDGELEMRRDNVADYLGWSIYNERPGDLDAAQRKVVASLVRKCERAMGVSLQPGREGGLTPMLYTLEPMPDTHFPFAFYVALQLGRSAVAAVLRYHKFERLRVGRLDYWCRHAVPSLRRPAPPTPTPMVLLHGVMGVLPYAGMLREVAAMHEGAVLVPIFHHCSIEIEHLLQELHDPYDSVELVAALRTMVAKHAPAGQGPPRASFLSHSLGSGFLAAVLKQAPDLCTAALFIDPICFRLADGGVLRNFLFAHPRFADMTLADPRSWFHLLQRRLVADEPTVQDCFRKSFWWSQNSLHPAELPCDALVVLSGRDSVAEAHAVHAHLRDWQRRSGGKLRLEVHLHESWTHGWLLLHPAVQRSCIHRIQMMALASASARVVPPKFARCASDVDLAEAHMLNAASASRPLARGHAQDGPLPPIPAFVPIDPRLSPIPASPVVSPRLLPSTPERACTAGLPLPPAELAGASPAGLPKAASSFSLADSAASHGPLPPSYMAHGASLLALSPQRSRPPDHHVVGAEHLRKRARRRVRFSEEALALSDDDDGSSSQASSTDLGSSTDGSARWGSQLGSPRTSGGDAP